MTQAQPENNTGVDMATRQNLVGVLNDLLQLDHDAIPAYQIAIDALSSEELRNAVRRFKRDHQRHVRELSALIRAEGGTPIQSSHLSTGLLKLAMQALGAAAGDRAVLLAFRANEWESVEKYARAARRRLSAEVAAVVRRGAQDERRHYQWAAETLQEMGAGEKTVIGRVESLMERLHGGAALGMEAVERVSIGALRGGRGDAASNGKRNAASKSTRAKGSTSARKSARGRGSATKRAGATGSTARR
jgi:rubrerythrin